MLLDLEKIRQIAERVAGSSGLEVVEVEVCGAGKHRMLRVFIDRVAGDPRGEFIVVEDCEAVTRQLQHVLEVENCSYQRLEVSSPGLDRPLKRQADFERFAGHRVNLTLYQLPAIMDGALAEVIGPLQREWRAEQLASLE